MVAVTVKAGTDSTPRQPPPGFLGGLFQTLLYHPALAGTPPEEGNWNHLGRLFRPARGLSKQTGRQARLYHGSVFGKLSRVDGGWTAQ